MYRLNLIKNINGKKSTAARCNPQANINAKKHLDTSLRLINSIEKIITTKAEKKRGVISAFMINGYALMENNIFKKLSDDEEIKKINKNNIAGINSGIPKKFTPLYSSLDKGSEVKERSPKNQFE